MYTGFLGTNNKDTNFKEWLCFIEYDHRFDVIENVLI